MTKKKNELIVPDEVVMDKIYYFRGYKVMLDEDLAELYGVETKQLKRQVRRNADRFPKDFMFGLTKKEFENLRSQIGTSKNVRLYHKERNPTNKPARILRFFWFYICKSGKWRFAQQQKKG